MKKSLILILSSALISVIAVASMGEYKENYKNSSNIINNSESKLYERECGACHFPYQPQLLPKRSWMKMMANLENHFKSDASLDAEDIKKIEEYLIKNAGESAVYKYYRKIINSISKIDTPLRISETKYFIKEHREIPKRLIEQKEVKSISNCNLCHQSADKGDYRERGINIPNYGKWDD